MLTKRNSLAATSIALLQALVYIWLCTVVQLTHTDDLRAFTPVPLSGSVHGPAQQLSSQPPQTPIAPCLAHEWSQAFHTSAHAVVAVSTTPWVTDAHLPAAESSLQLGWRMNPRLRGPPTA